MKARTPPLQQLPATVVLLLAGAALAVTVLVDWQLGAVALGLALLLAGGLRLTLPSAQAGWLAVRSRGLDATFLLAVGFALVALAQTIPEP